jgi:hypothetical protein
MLWDAGFFVLFSFLKTEKKPKKRPFCLSFDSVYLFFVECMTFCSLFYSFASPLAILSGGK